MGDYNREKEMSIVLGVIILIIQLPTNRNFCLMVPINTMLEIIVWIINLLQCFSLCGANFAQNYSFEMRFQQLRGPNIGHSEHQPQEAISLGNDCIL